MSTGLHCFTPYDVRGRLPDELNVDLVGKIGLAFAEHFSARKVVVGRDMRLSSPELAASLITMLTDYGVDVLDIGLCGTEEVYHAVFAGENQGVDGGIMITASHNPADYNGMKIVRKGARPVSIDSGLKEIEQKVASLIWYEKIKASLAGKKGSVFDASDKSLYIKHLLSYVRHDQLKPLKLLVNGGNGCAGPIIDLLEKELPFKFIKLHAQPDGNFPNGVPNPLLPEKREATARAVRDHGADLGIAWDGDFDRCFFYDETGRFIEGYYIVGLLASAILQSQRGASILHDPRLVWNTIEVVSAAGGVPVMTRTGHAFIKEAMRKHNGVYGGEMSAHHYFRDFGYCDSGMVPWLLVCQLISQSGDKISDMVNDRMIAYPVSGEINSTVNDPDQIISLVREKYNDGEIDYTDGLSVSYDTFRFNLRMSNTEPVIRLNVETRNDVSLLEEKTNELLALIRQ